MMNTKKHIYTVLLGIGISGLSTSIAYAACKEGQPTTLVCSKLIIESSVSTKKAYPAIMQCEDVRSFKIYSGEFYWNDEGPYKNKKKKINKKTNEVTFKLRTRNSGRYKIDGFLNYKNCNKEVLKTEKISAGFVRAG